MTSAKMVRSALVKIRKPSVVVRLTISPPAIAQLHKAWGSGTVPVWRVVSALMAWALVQAP
jgi:hypothetical protein